MGKKKKKKKVKEKREENSESYDPVCICPDLQRHIGTYIDYAGTKCPCDSVPGDCGDTSVHIANQDLQNKMLDFVLALLKQITF